MRSSIWRDLQYALRTLARAGSAHVLRIVFSYAGVLMAAGLAAGIAAALLTGRLLATPAVRN